MIALATGLLAGLKGQGRFLLLLLVGAVGAFLYVEFRQTAADRDALAKWAEVTCAASGVAFQPADRNRGQACARQIASLAGFKAKAQEETARLLADALAQHDARQLTDNTAARTAAEAARAAAQRMEAADAKAERTNLVDREWFAAVNGVAGLRAPSR